MTPSIASSAIFTLHDVNRSLIPALLDRRETYTASKLANCRHGPNPSWCNNSQNCTLCGRYRRIQHLNAAQQQITSAVNSHPGSVPLAVTICTSDCEPEELGERTKAIQRGWKNLFRPEGRRTPLLGRKTLTAAGWIDLAPSEVEPELLNTHLHALLVMDGFWPYSGRDFVRQDKSFTSWREWWQAAAGSSPRSVNVEVPRSLDAALSYAFKPAFTVLAADGTVSQPQYLNPVTNQLLPATRILHQQNQLAGLSRVLKHAWN